MPVRGLLCLFLGVVLTIVSGAAPAAGPSAADAAPASRESTAARKDSFTDFDPSMLSGGSHNAINLSRFEQGNVVFPGIYNLDVYMDRKWIGRMNVRFAARAPGASALPCFTPELMDRMGLEPAKGWPRSDPPGRCVHIGQLLPDARATFDQPDLRLDISVPQADLGQLPRGYVSPASWDAGVPAALLNYNLNAYRTRNQGFSQTSIYLGLNAGLNIGPWHLRQDETATWQSGTSGAPAQQHWHDINAYAQRDLPGIRSTLTLGDSHTDGSIFDSVALRGAQLATDDRMLPQSRRGYAPVIHGVADTNAKVTIRQNGVQIYQTTVAPGPFTINDLYPTGYGGALEVTVTEANGRVHQFSVPYASVAQLLRPGITRYDLAIGRLRNLLLGDSPYVTQATVQHGFSNTFTGYAGLQLSQGYTAALLGGALNSRYGAFAMDVTQAGATIPGYRPEDGQSIRLSYSKVLPDARTSLSVVADRYSSSGFLSLTDAVSARDYVRRGLSPTQYRPGELQLIDGVPVSSPLTASQQAMLSGNASAAMNALVATGLVHRRNAFTLSISQPLGGRFGALYANGSVNDYWQRSGRDTQFQVGYNNVFHHVSYNVSATRSRTPYGPYGNRFFVSISIPLGVSPHAPDFTLNLSHDDQGDAQEQALLNGTYGDDSQFNYGLTATHDAQASGNAVAVDAGYRSPYAVINTSYGKGGDYAQASLNVSGAVVAHPGGITFGQPTGDTVGIVHVPGAAGARVTNAPGVRIDQDGYALVPYLNPYQHNTVRIDPQGLPLNVQLDNTSQETAPYAGAVVMVNFKTRNGRALIAHIRLENGRTAPFGAEVRNAKGDALGVVGQDGRALLRGVDNRGLLRLHWNGAQGQARACTFAYRMPQDATGEEHVSAYTQVNAICRSDALSAPASGAGT